MTRINVVPVEELTEMSETKFTKGTWSVFNMVASDGSVMTPEEIGEYVTGNILVNPENTNFLFVSVEKEDGPADVCHVGNGPDGPHNAALIAASPKLYQALEAAQECLCFFGCDGDSHSEECENAQKALADARGEEQ